MGDILQIPDPKKVASKYRLKAKAWREKLGRDSEMEQACLRLAEKLDPSGAPSQGGGA